MDAISPVREYCILGVLLRAFGEGVPARAPNVTNQVGGGDPGKGEPRRGWWKRERIQ